MPKPYRLLGADRKLYESATPGPLGGNRRLNIYGRLDCPNARRWLAAGHYAAHRVFFADEATAIAAGYRPCGICLRTEFLAFRQDPDGWRRRRLVGTPQSTTVMMPRST